MALNFNALESRNHSLGVGGFYGDVNISFLLQRPQDAKPLSKDLLENGFH